MLGQATALQPDNRPAWWSPPPATSKVTRKSDLLGITITAQIETMTEILRITAKPGGREIVVSAEIRIGGNCATPDSDTIELPFSVDELKMAFGLVAPTATYTSWEFLSEYGGEVGKPLSFIRTQNYLTFRPAARGGRLHGKFSLLVDPQLQGEVERFLKSLD